MYDYLKGTVAQCRGTQVVLEISGVGWLLHCSLSTSRQLKPAEDARLFVHQIVREDTLALYGFYHSLERELFRELISVSGIGPKVALAILSAMHPQELLSTIRFGDAARLTAIPGIGKKTAGRLVLELGNRVQRFEDVEQGPPANELLLKTGTDGGAQEALEALIALGMKSAAAEKELNLARRILGTNASVEDLVRQVLKKGN